MSFGVSAADFIQVIELATRTVINCKKAPADFAEAGREAESLHVLLSSCNGLVQAKDSSLHSDKKNARDFNKIICNCRTPLERLDKIVHKFSSLATTSPKLLDRFRIPRKDILEIQGLLVLHTSYLSTFLDGLTLGSNRHLEASAARLEQHVTGISKDTDRIQRSQAKLFSQATNLQQSQNELADAQFEILKAVDLIGAELREQNHAGSVLSDHSGDEKEVWKRLRTRLIELNIRSDLIEKHEDAILKRLADLIDHGLWSDDGSAYAPSEPDKSSQPDATQNTANPQDETRYQSPVAETIAEDSDDDASNVDGSSKTERDVSSESSLTDVGQVESEKKELQDSHDLPKDQPDSDKTSDAASPKDTKARDAEKVFTSETSKFRQWNGDMGYLNIRARFLKPSKKRVYMQTPDGKEVAVPYRLLSQQEIDYVVDEYKKTLRVAGVNSAARIVEHCDNVFGVEANEDKSVTADDDQDSTTLGPELTRLVGRRTTGKMAWVYRKSRVLRRPQMSGRDAERSSAKLPEAAAAGDFEIVRRLVSRGYNVDSTAADTSKALVSNNSSPDKNLGKTALCRAAENGRVGISHFLLDQGADPNTISSGSRSLLEIMVSRGETRFCQMLLEYGAKANTRSSDSRTLLHIAADTTGLDISHRVEIVRLLLDYGADIEATTSTGETALMLAARSAKSADVVAVILSQGANVDTALPTGQTALYKAAKNGALPCVKHLLHYGASPNIGHGLAGETALYKAAAGGYESIVRYLITYGADLDIENKPRDLPHGKSFKNISWLMDPTTPPESKGASKFPLHAAAAGGHDRIVTALLDAGADVNAKHPGGQTAVYVAAKEEHRSTMKLLLSRGALADDPRHTDPVAKLLHEEELKEMGWNKEIDKSDGLSPLAQSYRELALTNDGDGIKTLGQIIRTEKGREVMSRVQNIVATHYLSRGGNSKSLKYALLQAAQKGGWKGELEQAMLEVSSNAQLTEKSAGEDQDNDRDANENENEQHEYERPSDRMKKELISSLLGGAAKGLFSSRPSTSRRSVQA